MQIKRRLTIGMHAFVHENVSFAMIFCEIEESFSVTPLKKSEIRKKSNRKKKLIAFACRFFLSISGRKESQ